MQFLFMSFVIICKIASVIIDLIVKTCLAGVALVLYIIYSCRNDDKEKGKYIHGNIMALGKTENASWKQLPCLEEIAMQNHNAAVLTGRTDRSE